MARYGSMQYVSPGQWGLVDKIQDENLKKKRLQPCGYSLFDLVPRAGIDKHISWHCARHSFAVNILNNGANIKTVASLLGHSGLKHTEKYTRAVDKLKEEAINSLPELKF